ncbi:hypothetical protein PYK79_34120 [Streptomyces sp. ID05-04B]|uniref:hypothetical protein n=1 Tax=unclassified Streptomyces TaxID=2593676 RepID=UPI00131EF9DC|nr:MULTISPECIES: hypothetical protein [unclassified Streptomyces]MDX5567298.1 hypothetical protein [Streptomyces sp. ID05-04B]
MNARAGRRVADDGRPTAPHPLRVMVGVRCALRRAARISGGDHDHAPGRRRMMGDRAG